jgi:Zn-dependent protease
MNSTMKKPVIIFLGSMLLLLAIFFLFPINLFDGVIIEQRGIQKFIHQRPLSLSYFIGIGYDQEDMEFIKDFYLTGKGYAMVFIFTAGIPFLLAYRSYLKQKSA